MSKEMGSPSVEVVRRIPVRPGDGERVSIYALFFLLWSLSTLPRGWHRGVTHHRPSPLLPHHHHHRALHVCPRISVVLCGGGGSEFPCRLLSFSSWYVSVRVWCVCGCVCSILLAPHVPCVRAFCIDVYWPLIPAVDCA